MPHRPNWKLLSISPHTMAKPTMTNEELQLKRRARRRLIGAVTLVTGLVVFLPMVLDNEPKPVAEDITINIPSQDHKAAKIGIISTPKPPPPEKAAPKSDVTPHVAPHEPPPTPPQAAVINPEPPAAKPVEPVVPPVQPVTVLANGQTPKTAPVKQPSPPEPPKAAPASPAPAAKPADVAVSALEGFVVRLGAFSKPENARQLKAKVTTMGIRNYTDTVKTDAGEKTLVRAGPFGTRREAEMVRDRLKAVDVDGDVVAR